MAVLAGYAKPIIFEEPPSKQEGSSLLEMLRKKVHSKERRRDMASVSLSTDFNNLGKFIPLKEPLLDKDHVIYITKEAHNATEERIFSNPNFTLEEDQDLI